MANTPDNKDPSNIQETVKVSVYPEKKDLVAVCNIKGVSGHLIDERTVQAEIEHNNIVYGIDPKAVSSIIEEYKKASRKHVNLSAVIAKGQQPTPGKDGHVKILVPPIQKVTIQEDGKADFRNISVLREVKKGDILAKKIPSVPGKDGIDIYNRIVFPEPVEEEGIHHGKNIVFDEKTKAYVALVDGIFEEGEDGIDVNQLLKINSNVGLETGNIEYEGEIYIDGNIEREASVKSKGDITINGVIESGKVVSGGSLISKVGINTKREGEVEVKGEFQSNYIENSNVLVHRDIMVGNSIVGSRVISFGDIRLPSKNSKITGSELHVYGNIEAGIIGSRTGSGMRITIGKHYANAKEYETLRREYIAIKQDFQKKLDKAKELKEYIEKMKGRLTPPQVNKIKEKFQEYKVAVIQKENYQQKEEKYKNSIYNPEPVKLIVRSVIYGGVEISYKNNIINIDSEKKEVVFIFHPDTGQYVIKSLKG